jgi:hypothetical protein
MFRNYKTFGRKIRWEGSLKNPRQRGENNIRMCGCLLVSSGSGLDQGRDIVNTAMNLRIP